MKKGLFMLAVGILCLTTACGNPKLKNGEEVVAQIDGKEYTADDLYKELKGQYGYTTIINWVDAQIAENEVELTDEITSYVDEALAFYKQYAEAYGMSLPEFAAQYMGISGINDEESLKEFLLNDRRISLAIQARVAEKVKETDVKSFYDENYSTIYTYREILITDDDDADETISKIMSELKGKKGDELVEKFSELAEENSSSSSAEDGGLVASATKNLVDETIWKKLKDLGNKEYTKDAIKLEDGFYIILKISKDKTPELKDVSEEIKNLIAEEQLSNDQSLQYDILTELRNKYKIVFFDEDMKNDYKDYLDELKEYKKQLAESSSTSDEEQEDE